MYPRSDARLLPLALHPAFGDARVPGTVRRSLGLSSHATLGELDASLWSTAPRDAVHAAAAHVVYAVRSSWQQVMRSNEQVLVQPTDLSRYELAVRTYNAVARYVGREGRARSIPIGELAQIPQLGALSLLDLLIALELSEPGGPTDAEAASEPVRRKSSAVATQAAKLARQRWSTRLRDDDVRFGPLVADVDPSARTAREAASLARDRTVTPAEARQLAISIARLLQSCDAARRLDLRRELSEILSAVITRPNQQSMVSARLGLAGRAPLTLEGAARTTNVTRERVRQVEKSFRESLAAAPPWTPALDRALGVVKELTPSSSDTLAAELRARGLIDETFSLASVFAAANVFGKGTASRYDRRRGLITSDSSGAVAGEVAKRASALVTHWGATTVDEVCAAVEAAGHGNVDPGLARLTLESLPNFAWLGDGRQWFWLRHTARNRLLNQVEKIMSVAGSISIAELRDGVGRHHRMKGFRPPREVLAQLCVDTGLYERRADRIVGGPQLPDWRDVLGKVEATLADLLLDHGPVMRRDEFEELAISERSVNKSSFYVYLTYSPILARFAPGVYGLRGAPITAAKVEALIPTRVRSQVLQDHGWTPEGRLWVGYRISAAGERSAVLGVPGALKSIVQGSFPLSAEDGRPIGTLAADGSIWGLSPFYRRYGVEEGDYLVLVFDLTTREATIIAGTQELLLRFQSGE